MHPQLFKIRRRIIEKTSIPSSSEVITSSGSSKGNDKQITMDGSPYHYVFMWRSLVVTRLRNNYLSLTLNESFGIRADLVVRPDILHSVSRHSKGQQCSSRVTYHFLYMRSFPFIAPGP